MSFADPQTLTVDSTPYTLNKVYSEGTKSIYATADEGFKMTISHLESKDRTRRMIRIDNRVVATDPLTSVSEYKVGSVYLVIDEPEYGFTDDELDDIVQGFSTWLSTANVTKVLSSQH